MMRNRIEEKAKASMEAVKNGQQQGGKKRRQSIFQQLTSGLTFVSRREEVPDEAYNNRPNFRKSSIKPSPNPKHESSIDVQKRERSASDVSQDKKVTRAKSQHFIRNFQEQTLDEFKMNDVEFVEEVEVDEPTPILVQQDTQFRSKAKLLLEELKETGHVEDESTMKVMTEILQKRLSSRKNLRKSDNVKVKSASEYQKDDFKQVLREIEDEIRNEKERMENELKKQTEEEEEASKNVEVSIEIQEEAKDSNYSLDHPTPLKNKAKSEENIKRISGNSLKVSNTSNTFESPKSTVLTKSSVSDSQGSFSRDVFSPRSDDSKGSSETDEKSKNLSPKEKFFVACYTGDYETLTLLFEEYPDMNVNGIQNKTTLLHVAAANNCVDIIELLLNKGARVNILDSLERTPLHVAVSNGNYDACIVLLGRGSEVNSRDCYGFSPFFLAVKNHHFTIAEDLLLFKSDVNFKRLDGATILHDCMATNNINGLIFLVELNLKNLILNPKDANGETPLMKGVHGDHLLVVKYYLSKCQKEIKLLAQNSIGQNLIHIAAKKNSHQTLTYICSLDPTIMTLINQQDHTKRKSSPLHLAIQFNSEKVFQILLAHDCDINLRDGKGNTPLHLAYQSENAKFAQILIKLGANENIKNQDGMTAKKLKRISEQNK